MPQKIPSTTEFDGVHRGETIVLLGCAPWIKDFDIAPLAKLTTIGCNRMLSQHPFRPTYLMVSDRRPYMAEMEAGVYKEHADTVRLLFSTSMYDPNVKCHNSPVQTPPTDFRWYPWRVRGSNSAPEWDTMRGSLCSFANIGGPMLEAAVIMGAKRVGILGIGIVEKYGHFYGNEKWAKGNEKSPPATFRCFQVAKGMLAKRRVEVVNLNPPKANPAFERIWPSYSWVKFLEEECLTSRS